MDRLLSNPFCKANWAPHTSTRASSMVAIDKFAPHGGDCFAKGPNSDATPLKEQ